VRDSAGEELPYEPAAVSGGLLPWGITGNGDGGDRPTRAPAFERA
jgi:hypothetical protein